MAGLPRVGGGGVGDIVAQYKSEGFHGETMQVEMLPEDFNRYGFDLVFRMTERDSRREVARGKIGVVFLGRVDKKVTPVPEAFLARLAAAQAPQAAKTDLTAS